MLLNYKQINYKIMNKFFAFFMGLIISATMSAQSISGPFYMCVGSSSSFSASTWGSGYEWRASSNLGLSSYATQTITVTVNSYLADTWIAFYSPSAANPLDSIQVTISTGTPSISIYGPSSVDVDIPGQTWGNSFWISSSDPNILEYEWVFNSPYGNLYDYGSWANLYIWTAGSYRIEARARNACGWGSWQFHYINASRGTAMAAYKVYPNPVKDILYIDIDQQQSLSNANRQQLRYDIRLYDTQGNLALNTTTTQTGTIQIDVSNLRNGTYMLQIFDGVDPKPYATVVIKQ